MTAYLDSTDAQVAQNEAHKHDPCRRHAEGEAEGNIDADLCCVVGTRHVLEKRGAEERDGTRWYVLGGCSAHTMLFRQRAHLLWNRVPRRIPLMIQT
jgi:hypothetical protein